MNAVLFGINPTAFAFAKMLKQIEYFKDDNQIVLSGVMCKTIRETTSVAVELNIRAYSYFEDAIRNADILLVAYPDSDIPKFVNSLKDKKIRGKILCHFSSKYSSEILSCGSTNTYYSITLPYCCETFSQTKKYDKNSLIIIEGNEKNEDGFKNTMFSTFSNVMFADKNNKRLCNIAKRVARICIKSCLETIMHIFKIIDIYNENEISTFVTDTVNTSLGKQLEIDNIDSDELKKNLRLLNAVNYSDTKDFYRNMEAHMVNNGTYSFEDREEIMRVLKYK